MPAWLRNLHCFLASVQPQPACMWKVCRWMNLLAADGCKGRHAPRNDLKHYCCQHTRCAQTGRCATCLCSRFLTSIQLCYLRCELLELLLKLSLIICSQRPSCRRMLCCFCCLLLLHCTTRNQHQQQSGCQHDWNSDGSINKHCSVAGATVRLDNKTLTPVATTDMLPQPYTVVDCHHPANAPSTMSAVVVALTDQECFEISKLCCQLLLLALDDFTCP